MRDGRAEALRATIAERARDDAAFRKAYADLREACAFAIDPRNADRDLARLLLRHRETDGESTPVAPRFEAVLRRLPEVPRPGGACVRESSGNAVPAFPSPEAEFLRSGVDALLREPLGLALADARALDPWSGDGRLVAGLGARVACANESDPVRYARAARAPGLAVAFADSFRLPERRPTAAFDFGGDENAARIGEAQSHAFPVVVSDLRTATRADARAARRTREAWGKEAVEDASAGVRWMADRLAPRGVVAFLSRLAFVDEPAFAGMRAGLAREFGLVAHLALPEGLGVTFLVRGGGGGRILYAEAESPPEAFAAAAWRELHPTAAHVWRTEILREEWTGFLSLIGERGAIFTESRAPMPEGADAAAPSPKARRVLQGPFLPAWRTLDRRGRREPPPGEGSTLVVLREPFGVMAADAPLDRRFGGAKSPPLAVGGRVSAEALRRFRVLYGAAVVERDVMDAVLALLHHPEYRVRYREDLRRGVPRLPLPGASALAGLATAPGAPPVGPGTAFRTGWLAESLFEPGTVPDYDDPFASPYARADVDPGFLRLVGLGAALARVQIDFERLRPYPLVAVGEPGPVGRMRLSPDRARLTLNPAWTLERIPPESFEARFGRRSLPEWVVEGFRTRTGFDPHRADDPERPARLFAQAVAASLETRRLAAIVERIAIAERGPVVSALP